MSKPSEYIRGTKRLAIIQKWLNGVEDPNYEVFPTRKEGKYIVKKREKMLEENKDTEQMLEEKKDEAASTRNLRQAEDNIDNKDDREVDKKSSMHKENEEPEDSQNVSDTQSVDEEEEIKEEHVIPKPKQMIKVYPRINNDDSYLLYQILIQLQHITDILVKNRQDKEMDKMINDIVEETLRLQEKNKKDDSGNSNEDLQDKYEWYAQQLQIPLKRRVNNIFADMNV